MYHNTRMGKNSAWVILKSVCIVDNHKVCIHIQAYIFIYFIWRSFKITIQRRSLLGQRGKSWEVLL